MKKILVVDDKEEISKVLNRILESKGHTIDLCCNGEEASQMYDDNHYDLVVTDILMPEKDGLEFSSYIREKEKNTDKYTPIIAITGGGTVVSADMAHEAAKIYADDVLIKPFNSETFMNAVEKFIKN